MRFDRKAFIVSAAGSGIGAATAKRLFDEGASVCLTDIDEAAATETIKAMGGPHDRLLLQVCDASDEIQVAAMVEVVVRQFGKIDGIVNNAGFSIRGRADVLQTADWHRVHAVALDSVFFGSRAALPHLIATRGCIVNTASISGMFADKNFTAYASAKGAVINLTRAMAIDFASLGVRVNSVSPGLVDTRLTRKFIENEDTSRRLTDRIPMGRPAQPSEIANAIAFLASPDASYITGANLVIDGGVTAATGQPDFVELGKILAGSS